MSLFRRLRHAHELIEFGGMRIWSLHPRYLDAKGLVAVWREALLAQAVLSGRRKGYARHPQLHRFWEHKNPEGAIAAYLNGIVAEADARGYRFDVRLIQAVESTEGIPVTRGQLTYEWEHLLAKLVTRDPDRYLRLSRIQRPNAHPFFRIVPGEIASWERVTA